MERVLTQGQRAHLAMLTFSALVAGSFSLGHLAAPFIAPEAMTVGRFCLSALLVGGAAAPLSCKSGANRQVRAPRVGWNRPAFQSADNGRSPWRSSPRFQ